MPKSLLPLLIGILYQAAVNQTSGAQTLSTIYRTGFEASEGYNANLDLIGQKGWLGGDSGGNGLGTGLMSGPGQQAYIGFAPPQAGDSALYVYYPLNRSLLRAQFSVTMAVIDSSNNQWDDFYWSVYNTGGYHLFTLDFDNYELKIYYYLDTATNRVWSGVFFTNGVASSLSMNLDFEQNRWSATFNNRLLATNKLMTTTGLQLDLGDIDAVWSLNNTNAPGDNYMAFDNYTISGIVAPPQLAAVGMLGRSPILRVSGLPGNTFAVEGSTDLRTWSSLKTNVTATGSFDFVDTTAAGVPFRFYRSRWVP